MPEPVPFPETLTTPRLTLRVPTAADGPEMAEIINANLEYLGRWLPWAQTPRTSERQSESMAQAHDRFLRTEDLMYLIVQGGRIIGSTGIHRIDWDVPVGDIGYWVAKAETGHGYVTEAAQAQTELALRPVSAGGLGFERIEIRCDPHNARSAAVPTRLGYTLEARLKRNARAADDASQLRDTLVFARWPSGAGKAEAERRGKTLKDVWEHWP